MSQDTKKTTGCLVLSVAVSLLLVLGAAGLMVFLLREQIPQMLGMAGSPTPTFTPRPTHTPRPTRTPTARVSATATPERYTPTSHPVTALPQVEETLDGFSACFVTDIGGLYGNSLNTMVWEGLQMAQDDLGITARAEESSDASDYSLLIDEMVGQDCDVIITAGYLMQESTEMAAYQNPAVHFIGVEQDYVEFPPNLTVLYFNEDEGGFLMGVLSAMTTQTNQVGAICGPDFIPSLWRYCEGFRAGVAYQDSSVLVDVIYYDGDISEAFFDTDWTTEQAHLLANYGCDRFFVGFPLSGDAALEELSGMSTADWPLLGMGIENDMHETLPVASDILLSSAVKRYDLGVYILVDLARQGELESGKIYGEMDYAQLRNLQGFDQAVITSRLDEVSLMLNDGRLESGVPTQKP